MYYIGIDLGTSACKLLREYHPMKKEISSYICRLKNQLRQSFPQYLPIFSKLNGKASMAVLSRCPSPESILKAGIDTLAGIVEQASGKGRGKGEREGCRPACSLAGRHVFRAWKRWHLLSDPALRGNASPVGEADRCRAESNQTVSLRTSGLLPVPAGRAVTDDSGRGLPDLCHAGV